MNSKEPLGKRFADWVNADENLPTLEELEKAHHHEEDNDEASTPPPTPKETLKMTENLAGQSVTVDVVDAALLYPDEVPNPEAANNSLKFSELVFADMALEEDRQKQGLRDFSFVYGFCAVLIVLFLVGTLLMMVTQLPPVGSPNNPTVNEVSKRYLEKGVEETGATNAVAGMILDYRAFDTLGESFVLFTATMGVVMLLRRAKISKAPPAKGGGN